MHVPRFFYVNKHICARVGLPLKVGQTVLYVTKNADFMMTIFGCFDTHSTLTR